MTTHAKPEEPLQGPVRERHAELAAEAEAAIQAAEHMMTAARDERAEDARNEQLELDVDIADRIQRVTGYAKNWEAHIHGCIEEDRQKRALLVAEDTRLRAERKATPHDPWRQPLAFTLEMASVRVVAS